MDSSSTFSANISRQICSDYSEHKQLLRDIRSGSIFSADSMKRLIEIKTFSRRHINSELKHPASMYVRRLAALNINSEAIKLQQVERLADKFNLKA